MTDSNTTKEPEPPSTKRPLAEAERRATFRLRRFQYRLGEMVFLIAIASLVGVTGFGAYANFRQDGWSSDAAAWAQAAGSIIAIAGAAWLARGEVRQVRRWRREQGEEAAWSVRFVIQQSRSTLR